MDISPIGDQVALEINKQHGDGTALFIKANTINKGELAGI